MSSGEKMFDWPRKAKLENWFQHEHFGGLNGLKEILTF